MGEPEEDGGLVASLHGALDDGKAATPTATLALVYARHIDAATHVRLPMDKALGLIRRACEVFDDSQPPGTPSAEDALHKVAAALSAVTVAGDLGPKLLAALDALLLTPKAAAAVAAKLPAAGAPANPLAELRGQHDELKARRDRRPAG